RTCRAWRAVGRKVQAPEIVFVAEGPQSGVQGKHVRVAPEVGIDLLFTVSSRVDGDADARRPHVREGMLRDVADKALLFPADTGVQGNVSAHLPGIVDVGSMVLSGAHGDTPIKAAA